MSGKQEDDPPPWMQPVDEESAEVAQEGRLMRWRGYLTAGLAIAALTLFSTALWYLYQAQLQPQEPIRVAAPETPVRVEPGDRGGMQVAHRDMSVYEQVAGADDGAPQPVTLRPGPETASAAPEAPGIDGESPVSPRVVGAGRPVTDGVQPAAYVMSSRRSDAQSAESDDVGRDAGAASASPDRDASWAVQIAAYRQERNARAFMAKSRTDHPDILGEMDGWVVKARKDMANYFRVRFGPLPDRATALSTCRAIQDAGLNCLIIAPGG